MSRTIDEKVVEMRFDNSDFERNVSQSMSTLDKLKSALNFSGAEKAFDGISSAANRIDFGPLGGALEGVGEKFSVLKTIATGALMHIGSTIESELTSKLKAVTIDQFTAGWNKYAEKTTAVQTIMNATGRSIDDVSEKLATLNWFTDETSYNFTDMTNSIGKFTSQGVELEDAVAAMEGISTAAALAGQDAASASRVMYNFSQSLGMGAVKLQDWMSVENANMATEEFKQTIIDTAVELGKLDQYGNILEIKSDNYSGDGFVNIGNFRSTLAAGWFDDEVLIESMKKFGGFAGRLNEVYDQFNENYDVTTSQILSWLNEYMDGTLDIEEAVRKTGLTAEEILPILEELSSDEYELGRRAFAAAQEAKTFKDVVNATADAVSTAWMNVFENIFGNYEEAKVTWTELANELWDIFAGPISNLNDLLTDWHNMGGRDDFIQSIKNMYAAVRSVLDPIGEAWSIIFPPKTGEDIFKITKRFREFTEGLIVNEEWMGRLGDSFQKIFGVIKLGTDGLTELKKAFFSGDDEDNGFFFGIGIAIEQIGNSIGTFVDNVRQAKKDLMSGVSPEAMLERYGKAIYTMVDGFQKLKKSFSVIGDYTRQALSISDYFVYYGEAGSGLAGIINIIAYSLRDVLDTAGRLIKIWTGVDLSDKIEKIENFIFNIERAIEDLQADGKLDELREKFLSIFKTFENRFGSIRSWFKPFREALSSIVNDFGEGLGKIFGDGDSFYDVLSGGIDSIEKWIDSVNKLIETSKVLKTIVDGIKTTIKTVADFLARFLSLSDTIDTYVNAGGGLAGVLAVIHDKLKIILDTVFDIIQNVTGFDIHSIGDGILQVVEGIAYGIVKAADTIAKAFGWVNNPFGKLLGVMDNGLGGAGEFNLGSIFENFGGVFQKLGDIIAKSSPLISAGISFVSDLLKNLIDLIPKIDVNTLIRIVQAIASIRLMISATDTLDALGETLEAYQHKLKADMLFAIAGAILMIAGAAFLIGQIDADKIGLVLGTLGTAFAGLIGTLVASKFGNAGVLAALPGAVLSLAGAMVIMAKAAGMMAGPIEAFSKIENFWESFGKLAAVMGGFLGLLGILGAINSSGSVLGAAKAISSLAGVLALMFPIVLAYSLVDAGAFAEGLKKIALALLELGGTLAVLGLFESLLNGRLGTVDFGGIGNGLLKVAAALGVMVGVLFALTKIDGAELGAALGKLALALLAIVAGFAVFSFALAILGPVLPILDKFSNSILKLSIALAIITGIAVGLGLLGKLLGDAADDIIKSGVNMIVLAIDELAARAPELAEDIVLIALAILEAVAAHTPEIVSAAVRIIGGIVEGIRDAMTEGGVNLMDLFVGSGVLAGLIGFVWVLKKMALNVGDFLNAALAIAGAAALLTEIGVLFGLMGWLSDKLGGPEAIDKFGEFAGAIADVFTENGAVGLMFAGLFGILALMAALSAKTGFKSSSLATGLGDAFGAIALIITEATGIIDLMGGLFAVSGGVFSAIDAIIKWLGGPEDGLVTAIGKFGEVVIAIADVIGGIVGHLLGSAVGGFAGETIADVMKGYAEGIGYIVEVGSSIGEFSSAAAGIESLSNMMLNLAKADFVEGITYWLGLTDGVDYEEYANGLAALGPGIKTFAESIEGLNGDDVEASVAVAEIIMSFAEKVPESGGLIDLITGRQDMKDFGEKLPDLATGLYNFAENIKGIDSNAVENAKTAVETIIELTRMIPENESKNIKVLWGLFSVEKEDQSIKNFSDGLAQLGLGLVTYSLYMKNIDSDLLKESNSAVKNLIATIKKVVEVKDADKIKKFGEKLKNFGDNLYSYSETISGINSVKMNSISQAIENAIDAFVGTDDTNLLGKIDAVGNKVLTEITNLFMSEDSKTQAKTSVGVLVDYIAEKFGEDTSIMKLSTKISDMVHTAFEMEGFKNATKQAGLSLVAGIQNGITEGFDGETGLSAEFEKKLTTLETGIASDGSTGRVKIFYDAGLKLLNGFKNGLTFADNIEAVKSAFKGFLDDLLAGITSEERVNQFKGAGETLAGAIASGTASDTAAKTLNNAGSSLAESIISGAKSDNVKQSLNEVGGYYAEGLANGISSTESTNKVKSASSKLSNTVVTTTTRGLAVASPSKIAIMIGKYFTEGLVLGMMNEQEMRSVENASNILGDTAINTLRENLGIHSPSEVYGEAADMCVLGFCNNILDGIPNAKEAVITFVEEVKKGLDYNSMIDLADSLGISSAFGNFEDTLASYLSLHGADTYFGSWEDHVDQLLNGLNNGTLFSGSGEDGFYSFMDGFTDNFGGAHFNDMMGDAMGEVTSFFDQFKKESAYDSGLEGAESYLSGFSYTVDNGTVSDTITGMTDTISGVYENYAAGDAYDSGVDTITSTLDGYVDGLNEIKPTVVSEAEAFGEAAGEAIGEGIGKALYTNVEELRAYLRESIGKNPSSDWFKPDYELQIGAGQFRPVIDADAKVDTVTYDGMTFRNDGELDGYLLSLDLKRQSDNDDFLKWAGGISYQTAGFIADDMNRAENQNEKIASDLAALTDEVSDLKEQASGFRADMSEYIEQQKDFQIVIDGKQVGYVITPYVNENLGATQVLLGRGI